PSRKSNFSWRKCAPSCQSFLAVNGAMSQPCCVPKPDESLSWNPSSFPSSSKKRGHKSQNLLQCQSQRQNLSLCRNQYQNQSQLKLLSKLRKNQHQVAEGGGTRLPKKLADADAKMNVKAV